MASPLADDLHVHAIHQKVADMGMAQAVQRDRRNVCQRDQAAERLAEGVRVEWLAVRASEHEAPRVAPEPELQPFLGLNRAVLLQGLNGDGGQCDRAPTCLGLWCFEGKFALD